MNHWHLCGNVGKRHTDWYATPPVEQSTCPYSCRFHCHSHSISCPAAVGRLGGHTAVGVHALEAEVWRYPTRTDPNPTHGVDQHWIHQHDRFCDQCEWLCVQRVGLDPASDSGSGSECDRKRDIFTDRDGMDRMDQCQSDLHGQDVESEHPTLVRRIRCRQRAPDRYARQPRLWTGGGREQGNPPHRFDQPARSRADFAGDPDYGR